MRAEVCGSMTQDWSKMLKSFRTKTYRSLQEENQVQQRHYHEQRAGESSVTACLITSADSLCQKESEVKERATPPPSRSSPEEAEPAAVVDLASGSHAYLATRGRSASEPSFLSVSRAVKVLHGGQHLHKPAGPSSSASSTSSSCSSSSAAGNPRHRRHCFHRTRSPHSTPPTVKEIGSITGLQQQIKAAFGRWRKRGGQQSLTSPHAEDEVAVGGTTAATKGHQSQAIREDSFDHPLNIRVSPHSQTFSHPHRLTVFPPFPAPGQSSSSPSASSAARGSSSNNNNNNKSNNPFAFVRGLRIKRRGGDSEPLSSTSSCSAAAAASSSCAAGGAGWTSCSVPGQDFVTSFPLTSKSRSDHSLHRILKDDNAWTVFATLRPPASESGEPLTKGGSTTAWTFGLFSDAPASQRRSAGGSSSNSSVVKSKCKAASVAPSPELLHRSFTPPASTGGFLPSFLGRNERRTRSLERCSNQRVFAATASSSGTAGTAAGRASQAPARPPVPLRVRSRSLEKNYTVRTGCAPAQVPVVLAGKSSGNSSSALPALPARRPQVPPDVLATWCTFNEAFGGSRPKQHPPQPEPVTVTAVDERDSPGSPVFEELFLPPPPKFGASENKRNSLVGSCSCNGGHGAGVSCSSSKSTPRSSPVPQPETVLYGTREAPVLERHCVEGGEFIIAWLSHSGSSSSSSAPTGGTLAPAATTGEMQSSSTGTAANVSGSGGGSSGGPGAAGPGGNRSFINKPARGWLHSDLVIVREGITYFVRYIGCLEVNTSMKSLDFDTRSQIAKECINVVCETAGLKTVDKKRKVDRRIQRILGDAPHMEHAGSDVALTISSGCLRISTLEGSHVVACHDMPNISFASGGDPDTLDFVAYVAKDNVHGRACYVLECGGGLAQDVITTIGQAFELRFKEYLKRTPRPEAVTDNRESASGSGAAMAAATSSVPHHPPWNPDDPEYYNDLPGKVPPDIGPPPVPPLPNYQAPAGGVGTAASSSGTAAGQSGLKKGSGTGRHGGPAVDLSDNLIDLNADVTALASGRADVGGAAASLPPFTDHEYVNGIIGSNGDFAKAGPASKDPFDMHPFSSALPSPLLPPANSSSGKPVVTIQRGGTKASKTSRASGPLEAQLSQEIWFHGPISRKEAEDLLKHDGDFLVRESQGSQGQYVLTGMQSGHHKHLLLVDPEGVVRTKDRTFDSVSHLINYHRNNILPIISAESVLLLKRPVPRPHHS